MIKIPSAKIVTSEDETTVLASDFAALIKPGDKIVLNGQLGSGKTFFIKKVLLTLGINNVNSPTFAIVNEYTGKNKIYHFDFFRLQNIKELMDIGWQDYMNDDSAISFIEWGSILPAALPKARFEISIDVNENLKREFKIQKYE